MPVPFGIDGSAVVDVRGPDTGIQSTAVDQGQFKLSGRVAKGLADAAATVITDGSQLDLKIDVVTEGHGLRGLRCQRKAGKDERLCCVHGVFLIVIGHVFLGMASPFPLR
ncbi:hypothetical protein D3C76_361290 [compost metagenome]